MQRTIHYCDLCYKETNYEKEPIKTSGSIGYYQVDWVFLPSSNGDKLVCASCDTTLRRARDLQITLRPVSDTVPIGPYTPGVAQWDASGWKLISGIIAEDVHDHTKPD